MKYKKIPMVYKRKRSYSAPGTSKRARVTRRSTASKRYPMRRRYRYKRSNNNPRTSYTQKSAVFKGVGFPKALVMSFPYRKAYKFTVAGSGNSVFGAIRLNSLFDPDYAVGGSQPIYYNRISTLAGLYSRYLVYKADIEVVFRNSSVNDKQVWAVCDVADNYAAWTPDQVFQFGARPKWTTKQIEGVDTGGPLSRFVYKRTVHLASLYGITKTKLYAENDFSAPYDGNPVQTAFLTFGACDNPGESVGGGDVDVEVYIRYHAKLFSNIQAP